jgi:hypothetical protein
VSAPFRRRWLAQAAAGASSVALAGALAPGVSAQTVSAPPVPRRRLEVASTEQLLAALGRAHDGGGQATIVLADGDYRIARSLEIRVPGVSIVSASGRPQTVRIAGDAMRADARVGNLIRVAAADFELRGVTLERAGNHLIQIAGESNAARPVIRDCVFRDAFEQLFKVSRDPAAAGVYCDDGRVERCRFEYTAGIGPQWYIGGVDAHGVRRWVIRDNYFRNIASPGRAVAEHAIHVWSDSVDILVERNVIVDCDRGIGFGLGERRPVHGGTIRNNFVHHRDNGHPFADTGIGIEGSSGIDVLHNTILLEHAYPRAIECRFDATRDLRVVNNLVNRAIVVKDGATAAVSANVLTLDRSALRLSLAGDLRLAMPVPGVVDRASPEATVPDDIDGTPRPRDGRADIGAHEWRALR